MAGTYPPEDKHHQEARFNCNLYLSLFLLIPIIGFASDYANADNARDKLLTNISVDLKQGLSVIVYQMTNKDKSTEQYADWSAYLNDFSSKTTGKYKVYEANAAFNKKLTHLKLGTDSDYTVFLKQNFKTYFYEGVIVESMVYMAVDNQYQGKEITEMDRAFMPDVIPFVMP